jgi:dihydrolipoamide dehydrogenase
MSEPLDVIIVGAGSAGLAALREVRKATERFVIVNDGPYGTTCARVGCMPSKALIEAANAFHARYKHQAFGIRGSESLTVDVPAVLQRVRALRDRFVGGTLKATDELGERSIAGRALLLGPDRVRVGDRELRARRIILAPGSRPVVPEAWRALGGRIQTTDSLFELETLPPRMAVIGLGAIGIEMAQAISRLGVAVSAFGRNSSLAGLSDDKVNASLRERLDREFAIHVGAEVELHADGSGVRVRSAGDEVRVDQALVAIGRRPNLDGIGLENLGVPLDARGMPAFDPGTGRIGELPVFIAGDANGHAALLHEAADEGYIAGSNATAASPTCFRRRTPIGIVFADPGVAVVGQRLAGLDGEGIVIGEVSYAKQGRARTAERNYGLLRLYAERESGRLLGAEMAVPAAEHLAHLLALAIDRQLDVQTLLGMPFYHPVLEEGLRTALRDASRQLPRRGSDLAACEAFRAEALD